MGFRLLFPSSIAFPPVFFSLSFSLSRASFLRAFGFALVCSFLCIHLSAPIFPSYFVSACLRVDVTALCLLNAYNYVSLSNDPFAVICLSPHRFCQYASSYLHVLPSSLLFLYFRPYPVVSFPRFTRFFEPPEECMCPRISYFFSLLFLPAPALPSFISFDVVPLWFCFRTLAFSASVTLRLPLAVALHFHLTVHMFDCFSNQLLNRMIYFCMCLSLASHCRPIPQPLCLP